MEQDEQVGRTVTAPPELFKDEVFGHVDHTLFEVNGRELMLECRRTTQAAWHRVQRSDIFTSWTSGDKGTYGDTAGWGIIAPEGEHGRSSWSVCGSNADQDASPVAGIGYCKGVDPNFGASSHMASVGFADNAETGEPETLIGCNGTGIAEGGRLRVWIR